MFSGVLATQKAPKFPPAAGYFFSTCIKIRVYAETKSRTNQVRSSAEQVFHYRPPYAQTQFCYYNTRVRTW